jgi:hypothetical protein
MDAIFPDLESHWMQFRVKSSLHCSGNHISRQYFRNAENVDHEDGPQAAPASDKLCRKENTES